MNTDSTNQSPKSDILVVEDNTSDLKLISDILTNAGYQVRPASDGELALRSVDAKLPDLVLLDVNLPGMGGVEVCSRLKADPATKDIPIIFISALGETELKVKALKAGGTDYVTKPIEASEILVRINTHLSMHKLQLRLAAQYEELREEIKKHKRTEEELKKHREHLEEIVLERTSKLQAEITKHDQTIRRLKDSEARYRCVVEDTPVLICNSAPGGEITFVNQSYCTHFNKTFDELVGTNFLSMIPESEHKFVMDNISSLTIESPMQSHEHQIIGPNGNICWHRWTNRALFDQHGKVVSYQSIGEDITKRRQAEVTTKEQARLLDLIFEHSLDSIVLLDKDYNFIRVSQTYAKACQRDISEFPGHNHFEFYPSNFKDEVDEVKKGKYIYQKSARPFTFADHPEWGTSYWDLGLVPILDKEGEIELFLFTLRDVTNLKQDEKALKKSEKQFQDLFNSITDLIYTQDLEGYFTSVNPAMHRLFGYNANEFIGHCASDFMEPELQSGFKDRYLEVIKKQKFHEGVSCYFKKNKEKIYIEYQSFLVEPDDGEPYINGIGRDVTEKVLSEKKVQKLQEQVIQAQKMESIGTLAGGIAHDFNNILFPIVGYTEMLLEDVSEESPFRDSLAQVHTSALRASELVKQILTFSRQKNGELKLMKIQPIIKEALKLIRSTIPTTIEIKQDIQIECGVIKADPTQIHQIIMNLATNAYHAMEETGGELKVSLKKIQLGEYDVIAPGMAPGTYACLSVTDTGKGMNKELIGKIFDPFFTTKEKGKGTGMGLSVIHGIVKGMKGALQVFSEPDKGAEFKIYFPVEKSSSDKQNSQIHETIQGGIERILLIDDEDAIITMEKMLLERLGYRVTPLTNSIEALEAFRQTPENFDLVITDMAMPNIPGDKLSSELVKIRPDIPVLLCTGFSEVMSEEKAASLGIKGFLLKPIVIKDLSQKIREVLGEK